MAGAQTQAMRLVPGSPAWSSGREQSTGTLIWTRMRLAVSGARGTRLEHAPLRRELLLRRPQLPHAGAVLLPLVVLISTVGSVLADL
jgi:hypothetical protein